MKKKLKRGKDLVLNSKRGNVFADSVTVLVILFAFGLGIMVIYPALFDINTAVQADNQLSNVTKTTVDDFTTRYPSIFDGAFVMIVGLLWVAAIVLSVTVDSNPAFLGIIIISLIVVLLLGNILAETYSDVVSTDGLTTLATTFPMTNFILNNLLGVILVIGASILIALYGKSS